DSFCTITLGFESRFSCGELVESLRDDRQICARDCIVEPDEDIAGFDAIAILHVELADNPASRVLHLFYVGIDDDGTLRNQRTRDLGGRRPPADADGEQEDDYAAHEQMTINGFARASRRSRG